MTGSLAGVTKLRSGRTPLVPTAGLSGEIQTRVARWVTIRDANGDYTAIDGEHGLTVSAGSWDELVSSIGEAEGLAGLWLD